ncbi:Ran-binding protein 9 [Wickerhamomyces ciferrii]|uniref:Ran-binding protein 9 n=1 Tax=Wickerhamomyces ciferrii (strain ATCC 14091 / BCRC 22168 / CBS 111 / JCM 3599 / NBRC 0793 / NRRL Y-1031 F-60-10) TaxID=1206466 RepID=K0KLL1_WICCF|nr:Ran-binding protein 9 [Wickerhamomyces ciferrii]CCH42008.1 Ran-binding protein 9 [Wickerhamomyces ciferrii]
MDSINNEDEKGQFYLPSYLLKTTYGEKLEKKLSTPIKQKNDHSITSKLSALGIMGNMPSRYSNADYDSELASIFSGSNANQSNTSIHHDRAGAISSTSAGNDSVIDDDIHSDDPMEEEDEEEEDEDEEGVHNIHYGDEMDVDFEEDEHDNELRPTFTSSTGSGTGSGSGSGPVTGGPGIIRGNNRRRTRTRSSQSSNPRKNSKTNKLHSLSNGQNPLGNFKYSLPTKWENSTNKSLLVSNNGLTLKIDQNGNNNSPTSSSSISKNYDHLVTKTNNSIPIKVGVFYFEIKVLSVTNNNLKNNSDITIGFMNSNLVNVTKMPGLEIGSYGFNGSDGSIICSQSASKKYNCKFGQGDIIGCGVNFSTKSIFYTKNGVFLGNAFTDINKELIPIIGLKNGNSISSNFGSNEFIFDIDGYIEDEKVKIYKKIFNYTKKSDNAINKINTHTDKEIPNILQNLVSSYFNHLGYIDISKTFLKEIKNEQIDESLIKNFNKIESISSIDENNLKIRQQIRKYLIQGDVESSIKLTNLNFPKVFENNLEILFQLNCQKLINFIKSGELDEAMKFGQSLRSNYETNEKFQESLNDIFSLLAFEKPEDSEFGYLLSNDCILKICDELNSEILKSLGKSSISNLEKLIKHNKSLIEILNDKNQLDSLLITSDDFGL